jgi:hypothetical protein
VPPERPLNHRTLVLILLAGTILRLVVLPLPGTVDVEAMKMWSFATTEDFSGVYGAGGSPLERRIVQWLDVSGAVTYPPMALTEIGASGVVYRAIRPTFPDSRLLTVLIKLPGLAAEILFVGLLLTWGRRVVGRATADWTAAAFWISPAIWFAGPGLGYYDAQAAVLMVAGVLAIYTRRPALVGALSAVAVLTKPQAVFFVPVFAVLLWQAGRAPRWRGVARAAVAGIVTTTVILAPFIVRGSVPNVVQAMSRLFEHDMLSGNAANLGWIATWFFRVIPGIPDRGWHDALTMTIRILGIRRLMDIGYPNFRLVGTALTSTALVWAMWRARRGLPIGPAAALAAWCTYAYMMLGAQVHENHLYMTIPMLALAAGACRGLRPAFWAVSVIFTINLYMFEGLGAGHPSLLDRRWTFIDMSVLLAVANLAVFVLFTRQVVRLTRAEPPLPAAAA